VAVLDLDEEGARRGADAIAAAGGEARALRVDVADRESVSAAFRALDAHFGRLDVLVNNAGIAHVGTVETTAEADFDRVYRVNVKGPYLCAQAALPLILRGGGGVILNMASIAALVGIPERFAYSMTKGAVLSMTRSIATDYMKRGVRCNCICPARVHTPFVDGYLRSAYPGREQEVFQQLSAYQPLGRMGTPEEVAQMALYLCSDEASFITGQAFPIDGGVLVL
jgi:NAD(P)-dependent dehydrogenase (short-subunit alcohol dehydrogenase family)